MFDFPVHMDLLAGMVTPPGGGAPMCVPYQPCNQVVKLHRQQCVGVTFRLPSDNELNSASFRLLGLGEISPMMHLPTRRASMLYEERIVGDTSGFRWRKSIFLLPSKI